MNKDLGMNTTPGSSREREAEARDWLEDVSERLRVFWLDSQPHLLDKAVQPCIIDGQRSLVLGRQLTDQAPDTLIDILRFARDNQINVQEERRSMDLPSSIERRSLSHI